LANSGKSLHEYLLQEPLDQLMAEVGENDVETTVTNRLIQQHRNFYQQELADRVIFARSKFNSEQTDIFDSIKETLDSPEPHDSKMFYVDGPDTDFLI
jgi:hypothetical protein